MVAPEFSLGTFVWAPGPEAVFVVAPEFSPGTAWVPGPEAVFVVALEFSPGTVFVSEPQVSVDIAAPFAVLVPVSVVLVGADSPGRPRFFAFPNID